MLSHFLRTGQLALNALWPVSPWLSFLQFTHTGFVPFPFSSHSSCLWGPPQCPHFSTVSVQYLLPPPGSSPRALPKEPKLGPPSTSSPRDNHSPNLYSIWLKSDISGTIDPKPPVPGLPVEGATSPTPRAGFPRVVSATTETVRNRHDPAEEVGGQLTVKTPHLWDPWVRSYGLLKFGQYGRQLSGPVLKPGYLRNQGS
ncbi:hypothetical protein ACJJTC_019014 [Scirpophaga incertulas]